MTGIRWGAAALGLALLLGVGAGAAYAQETTGRVTGRVTDKDTGTPLGGATVIVSGPQGEDATLTDDHGEYNFTSLPVGTYVIRFYAANTAVQAEQPGVVVSAEKMVRVNAKVAASVQQAAETIVITGKAPTIDVGSARIGAQFDETFDNNVPLGRTYGDIIERAPGAFVDGSGNVSIGGATGLENIYVVNGLNVTGIQYGNLEFGGSSLGGGSNLPPEFLSQIDVSSGGYEAESGGAMGGVVNTVLKSGSNEFHGSAFGYWSPFWMSANPTVIVPHNIPIGGVRKPDFDDSFGVEVGGPIIKDKLFFWVGFSPRITDSHVLRYTYAETEATGANGMGTGQAVLDANGLPRLTQLPWTARLPETHRTYNYAATVDFVPNADNKLTLSLWGTPSFNQELRGEYGVDDVASNPNVALEQLTKANTDVNAHWTSKLFDRHWQIDAMAGMHSEYLYMRSPFSALNNESEVQYGNTGLYALEHTPGCMPDAATGFDPCPISGSGPYYQTGGFGNTEKYTGYRWSGELKSTHVFEAGGRHELKYGWHLDLTTFDLDRRYTGGEFVQVFPGQPGTNGLYSGGTYNTNTFFTLAPGERATDYTLGTLPTSNLLYSPDYRADERAYVKSLSDAFFLQDSYSPDKLRNLTVNAGVRLELQKIYDYQNNPFLNTDNWSPRLSAVYDPFNDGRSKVSVSYGRFYEAVPLDVAARYFAGTNNLTVQGIPLSNCAGLEQNPYAWTGNCTAIPKGQAIPYSTTPTYNSEYAQPNLQGQYHNEIVATVEREIMDDMTLRLDYQHRWLGQIIEDGTGLGAANGVLANPGDVPSSAITAAQHQVDQAASAAAAMPNDPVAASTLSNAQYNLATLKQLAQAPKPERTYDAITVSLNKRFSKSWFARASYTYSRLFGNYEGLYQTETNYYAPNGGNAYDYSELYINQNGALNNDHPHLVHLDGFYSHPAGRGRFTAGLSFSARSGSPRNYISNLVPQTPYQLVFLLPRGEAGRSPTVTELDAKLSYARPLSPKVTLEGFIDLFNVLDQQAATAVDDNYTFDAAPPIPNGTPQDLKYAKNVAGQPVTVNPNFGKPLAYQTPFNGRVGVRITF
jgi:carboxypeptidase family protein